MPGNARGGYRRVCPGSVALRGGAPWGRTTQRGGLACLPTVGHCWRLGRFVCISGGAKRIAPRRHWVGCQPCLPIGQTAEVDLRQIQRFHQCVGVVDKLWLDGVAKRAKTLIQDFSHHLRGTHPLPAGDNRWRDGFGVRDCLRGGERAGTIAFMDPAEPAQERPDRGT